MTTVMSGARWVVLGVVLGAAVLRAVDDFVWPTPNTAFTAGKGFAEFVQPTESGLTESGLFGCVRTNGRQFHEGLDLFPVRRDRRGEATDPVFAIAGGVVRHVNLVAGESSYGRYIVIEHTDTVPSVISLYAHLASIAPEVAAGARVATGQAIGVLGRSAAGRGIPKSRAHLHLEVGFWLSRNFERWYAAKKFPNRNEHGVFNGMNIVGFDFLDYMERERAGEVASARAYVDRIPTAVTVVVRRAGAPDFTQRYPELVRSAVPAEGAVGWRIDFSWNGLPKAWWPLTAAELAAGAGGRVEIVFHDSELLKRHPCQAVVRTPGGRVQPGTRLEETLDILFTGL